MNGTEWLDEQDAAAAADFHRFVRLYAAAGEPFPAAAAVWRDLHPWQRAALAVLSSSASRPVPFEPDWMNLSAAARQRAIAAFKLAVELGAICASALELEAQLRRNPNQRELFT